MNLSFVLLVKKKKTSLILNKNKCICKLQFNKKKIFFALISYVFEKGTSYRIMKKNACTKTYYMVNRFDFKRNTKIIVLLKT